MLFRPNFSDLDLYVATLGGYRHWLFINLGNGTFSEQAIVRGASVEQVGLQRSKNTRSPLSLSIFTSPSLGRHQNARFSGPVSRLGMSIEMDTQTSLWGNTLPLNLSETPLQRVGFS